MPPNDPRQHHRLPEFYLKGFTPSGRDDDLLWVLDFDRKKRWQSKAAKNARQRDYYRINIEGVDPNVIEKAHQGFEDAAAPVLRQLLESRVRPVGESLDHLIVFVALL